jgi:DNA-binding NarL/FixJ family response regulator
MSDLVRLVVADDHRLLHGVLVDRLEADGFEIVGSVRKGSQVLPLVARVRPDAVLLEWDLPELDAARVIERLCTGFPDVVSVVLAGEARQSSVEQALAAGANAYISKEIEPALLGSEVRRALTERTLTPIGVAEAPQLDGRAGQLTEREVEIIRLIAEGSSNAETAQQLFITEQTVKFHLTNLYRKLGVANRTEAAIFARSHGLLDRYELVA